MPKINIEGVGKVTVGDEFLTMSPDQQNSAIEEIAAQMRGAGVTPPPVPRSKPEPPATRRANEAGLISPAGAHGLSLGLSDELAGAARAAKPLAMGDWGNIKREYQSGQSEEEERINRYRMANPIWAPTQEILGGAVSGGTAAKGVAMPASLGGRVARGAKEGAGIGGLAGFGYAGQDEKLSGTAIGAGVGGAVGASLPPLIEGIKAIGRAVAAPFRDPATIALEKIAQGASRDETTAARLTTRMQTMGPEATLADAGGRNLQGVAAAAVRQPGGAGNRAQIILNQRQLGQAGRITDQATRLLGRDESFSTVVDDVIAVRAQDAKPLYAKAYESTIDLTDDLVDIVNRPAFRQAFKNARTIALNEGGKIPELVKKNGKGQEIINTAALRDTRVWDYVKRGLDDVIEGAKEPITGKIKTDQGRALVGLKQKMLGELDRINPDFRAARQSFSGHTESLDALRDGRGFLKGDIDLTVKQLSALSDSDKEFFRIGVIQGVKDKVETASDTANAVRRIFGNQRLRDKLATVFPDHKAFREFEKAMVSESRFSNTRAKMISGSQTAERAAESSDLATTMGNIGAVVGSDLPGGGHALVKSGIGRRMMQSLGDKLFARPQYSNEIGRRMFTTDPAVNAKTLAELQRLLAGPQARGGYTVPGGLMSGGITGSQMLMEDGDRNLMFR